MKEYEIWMEGYSATGEHSDATFIGKAKGETFKEACQHFEYSNGDKLSLDEHYEQPFIWGCKLFDNEADARKSFG